MATSMTTQEVAQRLVTLCRKGQILEAQLELYADDIQSYEPAFHPMAHTIGKAAVNAKGKQFADSMVERHGGHFGDPIIGGDYFSISCFIDATFKDKGRMQINEICVFKVKEGKIIFEQFFY